jgi:hypothetical protein
MPAAVPVRPCPEASLQLHRGLADGGASAWDGVRLQRHIPLFVHHLTDSALLIGLVPAIHNMGWQLPQLLTARWISGVKRYRPLTLAMTIHERLPFLGLSLLALLLPGAHKPTILALTFVMLVWQGFGAGLAANPWTNLVSRVSQEIHGTFSGLNRPPSTGWLVSALIAGLITRLESHQLQRCLPPFFYALSLLSWL